MPLATTGDGILDVVVETPSNAVKKKEWQADYEADCSLKCRSKKDAAKLITGATRGTDQQSLAYLATAGICRNPGKVIDPLGRTVLHLAASTGKRYVAEWLIKYKAASLNSKDSESGYTPLHRALLYGHIHVARFLIECGANLALQDNDGLTPLDHINKDHTLFCPSILDESTTPPTSTTNSPPLTAGGLGEGYVWGTNANFNLGLGHQRQKNQPTLIEQLRRENVYISKVVLQKFHSAILTTQGNILTFGHGQGGRLGHGNEDSQLSPRQIVTLKDHVCVDVALGVDHSMFLTTNGTVWTCGSNASYLLGHSVTAQSAQVLSPQVIGGNKVSSAGGGGGGNSLKNSDKQAFSSAIGIAANRFHSLFWTKDALYTWGLNAGQLGHIKGENNNMPYITMPKLVSSLNQRDVEIANVTCSEGAIVVHTANGELIAMYEYQTKRRITSKRIQDISKIAVIGGHLDPSRAKSDNIINTKLTEKGGTDLKIFVLTKAGKIFVWEDTSLSLIQCVFNLSRELLVQDIAVNKTNLLVISKEGNGFEAVHISQTNRSKSPNQKQQQQQPNDMNNVKSPPSSITTGKNSSGNVYKCFDKSQCDLIRIKQRLFGVHRGVSVVCDPKGKNFCILQVAPNAALYDVPEIMESTITENMISLLQETFDPGYNSLYDVAIKVNFGEISKTFKAHAFILANASQSLAKQIADSKSGQSSVDDNSCIAPGIINLEFDDIRPELFEECLHYAYTHTSHLVEVGPCNFKLTPGADQKVEGNMTNNIKEVEDSVQNLNISENSVTNGREVSAYQVHHTSKQKKKRQLDQKSKDRPKQSNKDSIEIHVTNNPLILLNEAANRLGMLGLCKQLGHYKFLGDSIVDTRPQYWFKNKSNHASSKILFTRKNCSELSDVVIVSEDDVEFAAHRCILSARMEYFKSMFSLGWIETGKSRQLKLPIQSKILVVLLEYIYRDEMPLSLSKSDDVEFVCQVLAVADQLLVSRLVQMCERQAAGLLTLKNCVEVFQFANDYSAQQLAGSAKQFVVQNLATFLESKSLDILSEECMEKLTRYYFDAFPTLYHRKITPYANAPSSEQLERINMTVQEVFEMEAELELSRQHALLTNTSIEDYGKKQRGSSQKARRRNSSGESGDNPDGWSSITIAKGRRKRNRKSSSGSVSSVGSSDSEEDSNLGPRLFEKEMNLDVDDFELIEKEQEPPFVKVQDKGAQQRKSNEFVSSLLRLPYHLEKANTVLTTPPVLKAPPTPSEIDTTSECKIVTAQTASTTKLTRFTKMSQKERKRLSLEQLQMAGKNNEVEQVEQEQSNKPKWEGWGNKTTISDKYADGSKDIRNSDPSLTEIMLGQKSMQLPPPGKVTPQSAEIYKTKPNANKKPKSWRTLDFDEPSSIIDIKPAPIPSVNPWHTTTGSNDSFESTKSIHNGGRRKSSDDEKVTALIRKDEQQSTNTATTIRNNTSFKDIMHQEALQKENLYRAQSKSLTATQLEERAIEDLKVFYNVENTFDELITVERSNASVLATPVWNPKRNM